MDAKSVVMGYALGYNAGGGGGKTEEIEVEWKYPDDWLPLPKASKGECILLIRPSENRKKISIRLYTMFYSDISDYPDYQVSIEWGDGNLEIIDNSRISENVRINCEHEYSDEFAGQYLLIKIQTMYVYKLLDDGATERIATSVCGLVSIAAGYIYNVLAASVGTSFEVSESVVTSFNPFYVRFEMTDINELSVDTYHSVISTRPYSGYYREIFRVFTGTLTKRIDYTGSPEIFGSGYVGSTLYNLRTMRGTESIKKIHSSANYLLSYTYSLEKLNFPNLEEVPASFLQNTYGLRTVYMPKCTKIGAYSLSGNYALEKIIIAKNCEIDTSALQGNYQYVDVIEEEEK